VGAVLQVSQLKTGNQDVHIRPIVRLMPLYYIDYNTLPDIRSGDRSNALQKQLDNPIEVDFDTAKRPGVYNKQQDKHTLTGAGDQEH
jgi:hypothetical protein